MKTFGLLMVAASALTFASCSSETATEETHQEEAVVETVTYTLDTEHSTLGWKGMMSPEYFHTGTVAFAEGSISMEEDVLTGGSFVVDMATIKNTDIEEEEKAASLVRHLKGLDDNDHHKPEDFFNVPAHPSVSVTLGEYKDGKLSTTLEIVGKTLTQEVPVAITHDDNGATITGKFSMDFTSLMLPGLQANPETGEGISPSIEFDLNLQLTK